jgi:hypothetical protein
MGHYGEHTSIFFAEARLEAPLGFPEQDTECAVASRDAGAGERCSSVRLNVAGAAGWVDSGSVVI